MAARPGKPRGRITRCFSRGVRLNEMVCLDRVGPPSRSGLTPSKESDIADLCDSINDAGAESFLELVEREADGGRIWLRGPPANSLWAEQLSHCWRLHSWLWPRGRISLL